MNSERPCTPAGSRSPSTSSPRTCRGRSARVWAVLSSISPRAAPAGLWALEPGWGPIGWFRTESRLFHLGPALSVGEGWKLLPSPSHLFRCSFIFPTTTTLWEARVCLQVCDSADPPPFSQGVPSFFSQPCVPTVNFCLLRPRVRSSFGGLGCLFAKVLHNSTGCRGGILP